MIYSSVSVVVVLCWGRFVGFGGAEALVGVGGPGDVVVGRVGTKSLIESAVVTVDFSVSIVVLCWRWFVDAGVTGIWLLLI